MAENTSGSAKSKRIDHFLLFGVFIKDIFIELWRGVRTNTLPWPVCCGIGAAFAFIFSLRLDALAWKYCHIAKAYPFHPFLYWPYVAIYTTSGFWIWSVGRVISRRKLIKELSTAFRNAGLQTRTGRLPGFIADVQMDTHMRKMTVSSVGLPASEFIRAKETLESGLQIFIDQIKSRVDRGTVELQYAHNSMPEKILFDSTKYYEPLTFMVGMTRSKPLFISLTAVPHILTGGYTNSGKSGFVRQLLLTLMLNNKGIEYTLIDLKYGTEFNVFAGMPNTRLYINPQEAIEALKYVEAQLEKRMMLLQVNRCSDIDAFHRVSEEKRKFTDDWPKGKPFNRHVVAIDEAAELFMASANLAAKDAQVAKRLAAKIAALGRSVGIHLIISTQRPDRNAVDPLIKSNLQGRLCFPMADNASSMTILDSVRAADLQQISGRAIWRSGFDLIEVQVPWIHPDDMKPILAPFLPKKDENSGTPVEVLSNVAGIPVWEQSKSEKAIVPVEQNTILMTQIQGPASEAEDSDENETGGYV